MQTTQTTDELLHTFSAQLKRVLKEGETIGWEFRVQRSSFPNSEFNVGSTTSFTLDHEKYSKSFASYKNFVGSLGMSELPKSLLEYTITSTDTEIIVSGLTETTVRVAVVDLVSKSNGNVKLTMTRPETIFRVYKSKNENEDSNVVTSCSGLFGDFENGDY